MPITFALKLLEEIPTLIAAGKSVIDLVNQGSTALKAMQLEGRDPTQAEWDDLNEKILNLRHDLHTD